MYTKTMAGATVFCKQELMVVIEITTCKLQMNESSPIEQHIFIFAAQALHNGAIVCDYNMQNASTLHLIVQLCGGTVDGVGNFIGPNGNDTLVVPALFPGIRSLPDTQTTGFWAGFREK